MMSARLTYALSDLRRRPGRATFTIASIAIAVAALTAGNVTQDQLANGFAFAIGNQVTRPDLVLDIDGLNGSTPETFASVANIRTVQASTTLQTEWHVARSPGHVDIILVAYPDLGHVVLSPFELVSGRLPGTGDVVMEFGDRVVQPTDLGDAITVETASGTSQLRVVGISRTAGQDPATTGRYLAYVSEDTLGALPAYTDPVSAPPLAPLRVEHLAIKVDAVGQLDATTRAFGATLRAHGITVLGAAAPDPLTAELGQVQGVFGLLRLLALLALLMSGLLVLATVRTAIAERTRMIGTMKALGATRVMIARDELVTVAAYGGVATFAGLGLGITAGVVLAGLLAGAIPLALGPLSVDPAVVMTGVLAGLGLPIAAALWPIWDGTRISVRDALAGHGLEASAGQGRLARLGGRVGWLGQTALLGLRSTFRRRSRAVLTIGMLTLAAAALFVVQTASASVNASVGRVWSDIGADVEVYADEPYVDARTQLAGVTNIARIERFGLAGAGTAWGKVAVWGFEPDTSLYVDRLTGGRWLRTGDGLAALVSDDFATRSGVGIGGRLSLSLGNRSMSFAVIGTVDEPVDSLGQVGAVVIPVTGLYELEGVATDSAGSYANRLLVRAVDRSPQAVATLAQRVDAMARGQVTGGGVARGQGLGPVFLVHEDEALRHQRNFLILYALLYAAAIVVGAAGALGLASTLLASVAERQREIGLLRSMGASSWRLAEVFWVEGAALGGVAGVVGAFVGVPLAIGFVAAIGHLVIPIGFSFDPLAFVVLGLGVVVIVAVAGVTPAIRAARVRLVDLLRYE